MASDPNGVGEVSITFKEDGRDGTWLVFRGTPARIREDIIEVFNLEGTDDLTVHEVAIEARRKVKATGHVAASLGGRPAGSGGSWQKAGQKAAEQPAGPERDPLYDTVEAIDSVDALRKLWAENREAFDNNADLMSAWKTKGQELAKAAA